MATILETIKNKTAEEIAEEVRNYFCNLYNECRVCPLRCGSKQCCESIVEWLESEEV